MTDTLGRFGAELTMIVLGFALLVAATFIVVEVQKRTGREWPGWFAGIAAFLLLAILFGPAMGALNELSCEGSDDYEECIEGE